MGKPNVSQDDSTRAETRRIGFAKLVDSTLGSLLILFWQWRRRISSKKTSAPHPPSPIRKILFIKLWGIGSITLSEPALRWLRDTYPGAAIHYLTLDGNRSLLQLIPAVSKVHVLSFASPLKFCLQSLGMIGRLRSENYDLIFDGEFLVNYSGLMALAAQGSKVVGFASGDSRKREIQDESIPLGSDLHMSAQFLQLVMSGDRTPPPTGPPRLTLPVQPVDRSLLDSDGKRFYPFGSHYLVLNVNAGPLATERRWPRRRFIRLARALLESYELELVLVGSAAEKSYVRSVQRDLGSDPRVRNFSGCLDIPGLAFLLSRARVLISNDSGPVHIASALDVPVIAFYGPETPVLYGPRGGQKLVFYKNLPCSPCMSAQNGKTVRCGHALACMEGIDVAGVLQQTTGFLDVRGLFRPRKIKEKRRTPAQSEAYG